MEIYNIRWFCADQIDVVTNFAVITNVVIKRVHCIYSYKINLTPSPVAAFPRLQLPLLRVL